MTSRSRDHAPNEEYASFLNLLTWTHINYSPNIHAYVGEKTSSEEKVLGLVLVVSNWAICPLLNQRDAAL